VKPYRLAALVLAAVWLAALVAPARAADATAAQIVRELGLKESDTPVRDRPGWKRPSKIVVVIDTPDRIAWLQSVAPGVKLVGVRSPREAIAELGDADGFIGFCAAILVRAAPQAKWFHSPSAGVEGCVNEDPIQSGRILLTNLQKVNAGVMAEHVIGMMLALTRGLPTWIQAQEHEEFDNSLVPLSRMWSVKDRTMLVVGLGGIGTEVAKRAHALGMTVIATRNSGTEGPDFVSRVAKADELLNLVPEADVIVGAVPLTRETTGLYNAAFFARMKKDAYFINVGRSASVNQDDLIAALNAGKIGGAALDVTTPEILPKGHPLWHAHNILITPHVSGFSDNQSDWTWAIARENLRRYVAGEKMLSVVDPKLGY
jgi:phosphoglycerate dehydrogenase-like enzyme